MKADTDAAIKSFGKNEQVKKVFWILFIAMAGLVAGRHPSSGQRIAPTPEYGREGGCPVLLLHSLIYLRSDEDREETQKGEDENTGDQVELLF